MSSYQGEYRRPSARDEILGRILEALRDVPVDERPEQVAVERGYRHTDTSDREDIITRFIEYVADYKANVQRITERELPEAIVQACSRQNVRRLVVPADIPDTWLPAGVDILRDDGNALTYDQLDTSDGVLTGCALGIAQTGTIVLDGGALQGRRALSLLPDYALCIIREDQIIGIVPEAIARLHDEIVSQRRLITLVSGPSATSDIELSRVEGVHGPRRLDVLVVGL